MKKEIDVIPFTNKGYVPKELDEKLEYYEANKEKRLTGQKVSHKSAKKKKTSKTKYIAAISLMLAVSISGAIHFVGTNIISQNVIESNVDKNEAYSIPTSQGYIFYSSKTHEPIDMDKYLDDLTEQGLEQGLTKDEMAIYYGDHYGISPSVIEGSTLIGRTSAKLNACREYITETKRIEGRTK